MGNALTSADRTREEALESRRLHQWLPLMLLLAVVAGMLSGAVVTTILFNRAADARPVSPARAADPTIDPSLVVHDAEDFFAEFAADEKVAVARHGRRFVSIRGPVWKTGWKSEKPHIDIRAGQNATISCELDESERHAAELDGPEGLRTGDVVVVRGWCVPAMLDHSELPSLVSLTDAEVEQIPRTRKGFNVPDSDGQRMFD